MIIYPIQLGRLAIEDFMLNYKSFVNIVLIRKNAILVVYYFPLKKGAFFNAFKNPSIH